MDEPGDPPERFQPLLRSGVARLQKPRPKGAGRPFERGAGVAELGAKAARQAVGSAGRTDALVVAFATRRAIDRGVPLGYLETLLVDRFGPRHPRAVATIIT